MYQGAPAPVSVFMSAGPKAAAFAVFVRVFTPPSDPSRVVGSQSYGLRAGDDVVGNFAALMQRNIKRLLAYSSIAHAGYVLVAIAAHNQIGFAAVCFILPRTP